MNNQMIGIAGVFALTLFLLALRYFFLSFGRSNMSQYYNRAMPGRLYEVNLRADEDDSWLLWSPDSETSSPNPAAEAARAPRAPRQREASPLRVIGGR